VFHAPYGQAAGCEAGLRPAFKSLKYSRGYAPGSRFAPGMLGQARTNGTAKCSLECYGGAEPRLISGGVAAMINKNFRAKL
jgi:hypothetical protein